MARRRTRPETETQVLLSSRRPCAFCYGLNGDVQEKKGQIAHVNHDPSNSNFENLAFLCIVHHDLYDSKTRQSKGLTQKELLAYRGHLYEYVKEQMPISWPNATPVKGKVSKKPSAQIPLELYDHRLKIYHSARDLIIHVMQYASVELQRAVQFATDTDEALFLYDESVDAYLGELYKKAVRLRTLRALLENAPIGDYRSSLAEQEGEIVLWFSEQLGELRRKVLAFLQAG